MSDLELLLENTAQVVSLSELESKLSRRRPLRVKLGFDPSAPDLHLGHVMVLDKIRQFQDLGHQAVIIIGDYTARIGDPTGRSKTRPALDADTVRANAETYASQVFKILDPQRTEIRFNSEWFDRFSYADVLRLNSKISVAQLLEREDFRKRHTQGASITLAEFQYPLMQGWDSVMTQADVELGGTDQLFNNLVGRDLQRASGQEPQVVMVLPILPGTDGEVKMSKSLGNHIGLLEDPAMMFGKVMSISDELMQLWRELLGRSIQLTAPAPDHPMEAKKELASAIVRRFHGETAAQQAQADFEQKFSKKNLAAADLPILTAPSQVTSLAQALVMWGAVKSTSEARRLIQQGAVKWDGQRCQDPNQAIHPNVSGILQAGKKWFARIQPAS